MSKQALPLTWLIILIAGVVAIVIVAASFFYSNGSQGNLDSFVACLSEKGATMYGAKWCAFCNKEKQLFGLLFSDIGYVECPENVEKCIALNIESYPTWIFSNGKRLVGFQTLEQLAEASGCNLSEK